MSARAVLNAAYALDARRADELDRLIATNGGEPAVRRALDEELGLSGPLVDSGGEEGTNVVQLAAWVAKVNAEMQ